MASALDPSPGHGELYMIHEVERRTDANGRESEALSPISWIARTFQSREFAGDINSDRPSYPNADFHRSLRTNIAGPSKPRTDRAPLSRLSADGDRQSMCPRSFSN